MSRRKRQVDSERLVAKKKVIYPFHSNIHALSRPKAFKLRSSYSVLWYFVIGSCFHKAYYNAGKFSQYLLDMHTPRIISGAFQYSLFWTSARVRVQL
jgi:hypothetical protein